MQFKHESNVELVDKDQWETPDYIFNPLHKVFNFTVDVAAAPWNNKVSCFYSADNSALDHSWEQERVFCNPPHTDGAYGEWIEYAYGQQKAHGVTSVLVVPFNSETHAFRTVWKHARYIIRPYKRIKYTLNGEAKGTPTFDSAIVVFTWDHLTSVQKEQLSGIGFIIDVALAVYPGWTV